MLGIVGHDLTGPANPKRPGIGQGRSGGGRIAPVETDDLIQPTGVQRGEPGAVIVLAAQSGGRQHDLCSQRDRPNEHREGEQADHFYLVRHGVVAIETFVPGRTTTTIETIETGEIIGWSWLFPPYRWHFDARALVPRPETEIVVDRALALIAA